MRLLIDYIALQAKRIDIAMIAAAIVEVPRWYVAFAAIKEPWWAAVPMGILLAWGASAGWKAYFADRRRWLLLAINVISLVGALIVIAPVLYAMTFTPLDEINLATVMRQELLMFWAATLAITTFVPLIQIAAVKMYAAHVAPEPVAQVEPATPKRNKRSEVQQDAQPEPVAQVEPATPKRNKRSEVQQDAQPEPVATVDATEDATPTIDARAQALQMHAEGMTATQIARALHANANTVRSWLRRA